jgi:hypothetical protein
MELPLEVVLGLVLGAATLLLAVSLRRRWLSRAGGAIDMSWRLKPRSHGRGWVLGVGRYAGDHLEWFRVFSLSTRPRRRLHRGDLAVVRRRSATGPEAMALIKGMEIVELRADGTRVEVGLEPSAITGFLAWLEARPPGVSLRY